MKKIKLDILNVIVLIISVVAVIVIETGTYRYRIPLLSLIVVCNFLWYISKNKNNKK